MYRYSRVEERDDAHCWYRDTPLSLSTLPRSLRFLVYSPTCMSATVQFHGRTSKDLHQIDKLTRNRDSVCGQQPKSGQKKKCALERGDKRRVEGRGCRREMIMVGIRTWESMLYMYSCRCIYIHIYIRIHVGRYLVHAHVYLWRDETGRRWPPAPTPFAFHFPIRQYMSMLPGEISTYCGYPRRSI